MDDGDENEKKQKGKLKYVNGVNSCFEWHWTRSNS